jgi:hypothetical protein
MNAPTRILALTTALVIFGIPLAPLGGQEARPARQPGAGEPTLSGPYNVRNLSIFLIHGQDRLKGKPVITLEQALKKGTFVVHETGEVNELAVENTSPDSEVFIQFGDVVKGGRQDRIIANDVIIPPNSGKTPVVSFCVEPGRWAQRGREEAARFNSSTALLTSQNVRFSGGNLGQFGAPVHPSLLPRSAAGDGFGSSGGNAQGDLSGALGQSANQLGFGGGSITNLGQFGGQGGLQSTVWKEVGTLQDKLAKKVGGQVRAPESQSSLQLTLEQKRVAARVAEYVRDLAPVIDGQNDVVGYAFAVNGQLQGAELYASHGLFKKQWRKLLQANAVEAIAESGNEKAIAPVAVSAVVACLLDGEKGEAAAREVTKRIRLVWRETERSILLETRDQARQDAWLHRTYVAKKAHVAEKKLPPPSRSQGPRRSPE